MHIPRAICGECNVEMRPVKNGVDIEMLLSDGQPYYKIQADLYGCSRCDKTMFVGFGHPFAQHFELGYADKKHDRQAEFA